MSPPVQQRRLKWSDFNERAAVPNPTAQAALLAFFEVRFARKVPGDWSIRRLNLPRAHSSRRARFAFRYRPTA
jgi:hypothetical protein